ncbi:MAG: hypothetical protein JNG90_15600 [Planctomycetaceae bacterium]|nr:hypothetical protein [Planctomycetaceae bacterium]
MSDVRALLDGVRQGRNGEKIRGDSLDFSRDPKVRIGRLGDLLAGPDVWREP